eukprot:30957-Pelagococcus_subviridis.AAC.42
MRGHEDEHLVRGRALGAFGFALRLRLVIRRRRARDREPEPWTKRRRWFPPRTLVSPRRPRRRKRTRRDAARHGHSRDRSGTYEGCEAVPTCIERRGRDGCEKVT